MTNIALVILDTLRKDTFEDYFDWLPGERYEHAWSSSSWTVPAHGTLFTGRYPSEVGVYAKHESLTYDRPVLAEILSSAGYTTRGFSVNPNITETFEFTRGFDEFHYSWSGKRHEEDVFDWSEFISEKFGKRPGVIVVGLDEIVSLQVVPCARHRLSIKAERSSRRIEARDSNPIVPGKRGGIKPGENVDRDVFVIDQCGRNRRRDRGFRNGVDDIAEFESHICGSSLE